MKKTLFFTLISASVLSASCLSNIHIDFDFKNKNIAVKSSVYDKSKTVGLDYASFDINEKKHLSKSLQNGSNKVEFSYTKDVKGLNENYIYLLDNWYPSLENRCTYKITTNLPSTYKNVFEDTKQEVDNITFVSSANFIINSQKFNNINVQTYFLEKNKKLSQAYLAKSIEYIKLYENRIGKFPYSNFKVVENVYQTGYAMPTFTLIGSRLLSKPYILEQSLGHEILHQYFGSSISNDFGKGNWIEGLTTYLADDYFKKLENKDIDGRKIILTEYENYVNDKNEFPINTFTHKTDKVSSLIGYSKLSFVFYMLEKKLGSDDFNALIKKLYKNHQNKELNLKGLTEFFDNNSKKDLRSFFDQWLYQKGMIDFQIENVKNYYDKDGFWMSFDLLQDEKDFYSFDLPIKIKTYDKTYDKNIPISKHKQTIKLNFGSEILSFTLDEKIELFRKLSQNEKLLSISSLITQKNMIAVVDEKEEEKYKAVTKIFPEIQLILTKNLKYKDLKDNSVVFLDFSNEILAQFYPNEKKDINNSYIKVLPHVYNKNKDMAILHFGKYKKRYLTMLKYYSKNNEVILSEQNIVKSVDDSTSGIRFEFNKLPLISKVEKKDNIKKIYDEIKDKRIIYVAESHDKFSHHLNQLRVIKALKQNGKEVAIAMEMFQKPFQKDLDEYIEGKTSLNEFLKNSQYFKRWRFDYNLYKPILDYAKKHKIRIIALNVDRDITQNVSKKGLFSLTQEQKKLLPKQIDQSNLSYKKSLDKIFDAHMPKGDKVKTHKMSKLNLDFFYQSQLIWDEIMAQTIHEYLNDKKDTVMVVLAGSGHIEQHNGIPSRVFNRNKLPYKVILNNFPTRKLGDVILVNKTKTDISKQNILGVYLKSSEELIVNDIVANSYSNKIAVKKGDLILELNGEKVQTLYDLKRVLYFIDDFSNVNLKVKRAKKTIVLKLK